MNISLMYASPNGRFSGQYLIVVHVEIVGGREDGNETWEASGLAFAVHPVPAGWNLVTRVSRRFLADIFAQCTSHHDGI